MDLAAAATSGALDAAVRLVAARGEGTRPDGRRRDASAHTIPEMGEALTQTKSLSSCSARRTQSSSYRPRVSAPAYFWTASYDRIPGHSGHGTSGEDLVLTCVSMTLETHSAQVPGECWHWLLRGASGNAAASFISAQTTHSDTLVAMSRNMDSMKERNGSGLMVALNLSGAVGDIGGWVAECFLQFQEMMKKGGTNQSGTECPLARTMLRYKRHGTSG